ncbi:hypothetical protein NQZ68_020791 [Dissostichus eleginoides]|nr:hypothetical protein NQZ68_020791 [Dissostichus eleginoides]
MRRHADSISERSNLFTNLTDTGRVGVHQRSRQDTLEGRAGLSADRLAGGPPRCVYWRVRVACHGCVDVGLLELAANVSIRECAAVTVRPEAGSTERSRRNSMSAPALKTKRDVC